MKNLKVVLGCALALMLFGLSIFVSDGNRVSAQSSANTKVVITGGVNSCAWAENTEFNFGTATVAVTDTTLTATGDLEETWLGTVQACKLAWTDLTSAESNSIGSGNIQGKSDNVNVTNGAPASSPTAPTSYTDQVVSIFKLQANTAGSLVQTVGLKLVVPAYTPAGTYEGTITATLES